MTTSLRRQALRHPSLDSWGDFDRDDPFPLFAQVRSAAPVHEITLADGHPAWLVVGHDEAKAALSHPRLSKNLARRARAQRAGRRRGPARTGAGPAHARRRPARSHPTAAAG